MLSVAAVLLFAFRQQILWQLGAILTDDEAPRKADAIVVLGGDSTGRRILKAAELASQGYASKILVSGAKGYWGHHESYHAIQFAVDHGYPASYFIPVTFPAVSTLDEAAVDVAELRKLGVHKYLLVTTVWHTARAVKIFRRAAPDLEVHGVGSVDPQWHNGLWWTDREGRKVWLFEAEKTLANGLGI